MSVEALHIPQAQDPHAFVSHQFEKREQQDECYIVGMWAFLVTEIMFFGALFACYLVYRHAYPHVFATVSQRLSVPMGFINTLILLTSSLTMALAVHYAQLRNRRLQIAYLWATVAFACGFLVVKYFEYGEKVHHHLVPGPFFRWEGADANIAQLYFSLYFGMTGLHGLHVLIGAIVLSIMAIMVWRNHHAVQDYMPIEMAGLYWHFVDIVWIFLYPLLYLINPR
jgi:cytochrome c oxidase subunit 3